MTASISTAARGLAIALVAGAAFLAVRPGAAAPSDRTATPASLASVFAAARPGDTILLASGDYGVFKGAMKSGEVTLRPQPGAAATLSLSFSPAANITVDGVTLSEIDIGDRRTRNITVRNSDVPGQTTMHTDELQHSNVLFDHNVHRDWDKTDACRCGEGRISLQGESDQPTGITIRDSEFRGGMSDGIQNGSTGTRILDNTFHDLVAGTPDGVHTDAIQLYGSKATVIRGNYFHDIGAAQIMAPDGADHEVIEDNVFGPGDYPFAITIWSDDGSTIRHNTMAPGSCWFHLPCGIVTLGQKDSCRYAVECDPGRGTVIEDNILADVAIGEGKADFTSRSNLFSGDGARGAGALGGRPLFVAGAHPTTYEGFRLAPPSPGRANASDGRDRGIRGRADIGSPPAATASSVRVLSSLRSIGRTGRLRLRIRTATAGVVVLSGTVRPGRAVAAATGRHSRGAIVLRPVSLGTRAAGAKLTATVKLGLRDRATLGRSRGARLSVRLAVGSEVTAASLTIKR